MYDISVVEALKIIEKEVKTIEEKHTKKYAFEVLDTHFGLLSEAEKIKVERLKE